MRNGRSSILSLIVMLTIFGLILTALCVYGNRQRERSRAAKCLNNMKSISQDLKMYADDYDGCLPSSYLVNRSKRWSAADAKLFCTGSGWVRNKPPVQGTARKTWPEAMYDHLGSCDIPFCPSDSFHPSEPVAKTSYWYKLANDKAWYAGRKRMADYGYESDQVAFYERLGWHCGDTSGLRNGVRINASFIDTHVETIILRNATSGDAINCAANSDGEPMYYNTGVKNGMAKKQKGPATLTDPTCCYDSL